MNFLDVMLECNGQTLRLGKSASGEKREFGITKITGLESSELELNFSDNALVDGSTMDGKRIKNRPIHIEATLRNDRNNETQRQRIIKFFNPKYSGKLTVNHSGTKRNIAYELEGWNFVVTNNVHNALAIVADLICPDPFMLNLDNFGRNMAHYTAQFHFPWHSLAVRAENKKQYPEKARGLLLGGIVTGYRTLHKEVVLANDGDVPTGIQIQFVASRGTVKNPQLTNVRTGQFMRVYCDMEPGDVLLIDTDPRHQVIELNGVNYYHHIDRKSEPFELAVGNNYLEYDAGENYTNLDVNLYYRPKYLGV